MLPDHTMENYLIIIFCCYILLEGFDYWLEYLNLKHMKTYGANIPSEFEGQIDQALLKKTQDYEIENTRFGFVSSIFNNIVLLLFLFGGLLDIYNSWIVSINLPFILSGLLFFILLSLGQSILAIPFNLYHTFRIENKYEFNTMTPRLWITDFIKSIIISVILLSLVISAGLSLVQWSPQYWWLWVWVFFLLFSIFIMYISPYVIEPLFNKFTPIGEEKLVASIRILLKKVGIRVSRVFKMDASKRSKHTNAYFTGIGKVKRIVLFDTLIDRMNHDEILSVLAHEAGHWKKKHLLKMIIVFEAVSLVGFYLAFRLLQSNFLPSLFQVSENTFFAKIVILGFLGSMVTFPFTPLSNYFLRKHEMEADHFAYELTGSGDNMISSLVKLSRDNLSNLYPHPLYVTFHYSHPPVLKRIRSIKNY